MACTTSRSVNSSSSSFDIPTSVSLSWKKPSSSSAGFVAFLEDDEGAPGRGCAGRDGFFTRFDFPSIERRLCGIFHVFLMRCAHEWVEVESSLSSSL
ncbi:Hypothetical protein TPAR_09509 [Tolypocladium paradoxum]|uniref:Uncharacterized protein n=1 Tax=Tolypocladium paradoxum TaxID=94208 RepID=A0A2S4LAQ3_9HYPO|nr:Hypothetical protein TPAR_09509 [Tolypocladium paradoxum]